MPQFHDSPHQLVSLVNTLRLFDRNQPATGWFKSMHFSLENTQAKGVSAETAARIDRRHKRSKRCRQRVRPHLTNYIKFGCEARFYRRSHLVCKMWTVRSSIFECHYTFTVPATHDSLRFSAFLDLFPFFIKK